MTSPRETSTVSFTIHRWPKFQAVGCRPIACSYVVGVLPIGRARGRVAASATVFRKRLAFRCVEEYAHSRADADVWLGHLQGNIPVCDCTLCGRRSAAILECMIAQRCPESSPVVREHLCGEEVFGAIQEIDPSLTVRDAESD